MSEVLKQVAVIHYGEIAVKGKNRVLFERRLKGNLQRVADGMRAGPAYRRPGRLEVFIPEHCDRPVLLERLRQQPGVVWVSAADAGARDLDAVTQRAVDVAVAENAPADAPYAVRARRSDKTFPMGSMQVAAPISTSSPMRTPPRWGTLTRRPSASATARRAISACAPSRRGGATSSPPAST